MTIPWMMNCDHREEGWCLECVRKLGEECTKAEGIIIATKNRLDHLGHRGGASSVCRLCEVYNLITKMEET